jgi:DNA-binding transcriptional regulator YiaG
MMQKTILETIHETVQGLHDVGLVETQTMREFDVMCLMPTNLPETDIKTP